MMYQSPAPPSDIEYPTAEMIEAAAKALDTGAFHGAFDDPAWLARYVFDIMWEARPSAEVRNG